MESFPELKDRPDRIFGKPYIYQVVCQDSIVTVRVIGIGLGGIAYVEYKYLSGLDGVDLIAGADIAGPARERFETELGAPTYESADELLVEHGDEADAAVIITPHTLHYDQIMRCFDHDLNVFVEKPMVTGIENAVDAIEVADELNLLLQVGYQRHFRADYQELKRIVADGRIGDIHMVSCYLGQDWIAPQVENGGWRTHPELSGGGQIYDSGSHLLDVLLWVTESRPVEVAALMEYRDHDVDVNTALSARLERDDRSILASISISGDGPASPDTSEGIVIWGTEGRVEYSDDNVITVIEKQGTNRTHYTTEITEGTDFETVFTAKLQNFIDAIRGEAELEVPGEVGLQVTALTEAAYQAYKSGATVNVKDELEAARTKYRDKHDALTTD